MKRLHFFFPAFSCQRRLDWLESRCDALTVDNRWMGFYPFILMMHCSWSYCLLAPGLHLYGGTLSVTAVTAVFIRSHSSVIQTRLSVHPLKILTSTWTHALFPYSTTTSFSHNKSQRSKLQSGKITTTSYGWQLLYWALPASHRARWIRVMQPLPWIKEDLLFCLSNQTVTAVEDGANVCAGTTCSKRLWVSLRGRTVTD